MYCIEVLKTINNDVKGYREGKYRTKNNMVSWIDQNPNKEKIKQLKDKIQKIDLEIKALEVEQCQ